jgi:hypothetical protein
MKYFFRPDTYVTLTSLFCIGLLVYIWILAGDLKSIKLPEKSIVNSWFFVFENQIYGLR